MIHIQHGMLTIAIHVQTSNFSPPCSEIPIEISVKNKGGSLSNYQDEIEQSMETMDINTKKGKQGACDSFLFAVVALAYLSRRWSLPAIHQESTERNKIDRGICVEFCV